MAWITSHKKRRRCCGSILNSMRGWSGWRVVSLFASTTQPRLRTTQLLRVADNSGLVNLPLAPVAVDKPPYRKQSRRDLDVGDHHYRSTTLATPSKPSITGSDSNLIPNLSCTRDWISSLSARM